MIFSVPPPRFEMESSADLDPCRVIKFPVAFCLELLFAIAPQEVHSCHGFTITFVSVCLPINSLSGMSRTMNANMDFVKEDPPVMKIIFLMVDTI